ncbi:MAG: hypothetical protein WCJ26_13640 [bacterium]
MSSLETIEQKLDKLIALLDTDRDLILVGTQIMYILGIKRSTFMNRVNELQPYGLFKDGERWKMRRASLEKYINDHPVIRKKNAKG